jgi:hypothetical protein
MMYLPGLEGARFVRMYFFRDPQRGPCSCVLVTDCRNSSRVQYAHVMYVYEGGDFLTGRPCLAVASEVNRMASAGSGRSHFLGLFPGEGHVNLGAADDWADMDRFAAKALEVIAEQFSLPKPPEEIEAPTMMVQRFRVPRASMAQPSAAGGQDVAKKAEPKKWWQFWK